MLFNSLEFALFFPVVLAGFAASPERWRGGWLLAASWLFYAAWEPLYLGLIGLSTIVDWVAARRIAAAEGRGRAGWLSLSLGVNLGLLGLFKYRDFSLQTLATALGGIGIDWTPAPSSWLLPVGISFYTFQTLAYTIDVYRGRLAPERSLLRFSLYVSFFPQLVAGPIERASRLLPQLSALPRPTRDQLTRGLRLAAWGLFKKVVVADRLGVVVDAVHADPGSFGGFAIVVASIFFVWQLYCDFSGYSDIAIGVARTFGVELVDNFDQPHLATSLEDFWRRWHISLSTWFRDYVYLPLGGNRVSAPRWALNVLVVFAVSGLWHGASWLFVLWGVGHGALLVAERATARIRGRLVGRVGLDRLPALHRAVRTGTTLLWWAVLLVPFRADSWADLVTLTTRMGHGWAHLGDPAALEHLLTRLHVDPWLFGLSWLLCPLVELVDLGWRRPGIRSWIRSQPPPVRWMLDYAVIIGVLGLGVWSDEPFVYFQFCVPPHDPASGVLLTGYLARDLQPCRENATAAIVVVLALRRRCAPDPPRWQESTESNASPLHPCPVRGRAPPDRGPCPGGVGAGHRLLREPRPAGLAPRRDRHHHGLPELPHPRAGRGARAVHELPRERQAAGPHRERLPRA